MSKHTEQVNTAPAGPSRLTMAVGVLLLLSALWAFASGGLALVSGNVREMWESRDRRIENLAGQDTARLAISEMRSLAGQAIEAVAQSQDGGGPIAQAPAGSITAALAANTNPDGGALTIGVLGVLLVIVLLLRKR